MSPLGTFFGFIAVLCPVLVVFHPSLSELAVVYALDFVALYIAHLIDRRTFLKLYPDTALFFPEPDYGKFKDLTVEGKVALLNSLIRFPQRRALYFFLVSFLKVTPVMLVIIFVWEPDVSRLDQALKILTIELIVNAYIYGSVFIEFHRFVSTQIAEFHERYDWSDAFAKVDYPDPKREFALQESISLLAVTVFMLVLQWLVVWNAPISDPREEAVEVILVGASGFLLFARIWYLGRRYFTGGLQELFKRFESFEYDMRDMSIPLHSSALLARFERTFNTLTERLRANERQLSEWLVREAEQHRFRALGEVSGLIAHDLAGPLHAIQFCAQELQENPERLNSRKYLEQLTLNTDRCVELIKSLRAYLKEPEVRKSSVLFGETHDYVLRLMKTQFQNQGFEKIRFVLEPALLEVRFAVAHVDMVHILYNLYKNSIENFIAHGNEDPEIQVGILEDAAETLQMFIKDNGSGLGVAEFENLTAFQFSRPAPMKKSESLGLRLTRRLIERGEGALSVVPGPGFGTMFSLTLRKKLTSTKAAP